MARAVEGELRGRFQRGGKGKQYKQVRKTLSIFLVPGTDTPPFLVQIALYHRRRLPLVLHLRYLLEFATWKLRKFHVVLGLIFASLLILWTYESWI